MQITEDIIYFIWKFRLFDTGTLLTTDGEPVVIYFPGYHNHESGPDFESGKVRINGLYWCGNIEIHVKSSDWYLHQHANDRYYDTVVLHVVYEYDMPVHRSDGALIPALELKSLIDRSLMDRYRSLMRNLSWIPCEQQISGELNRYMRGYLPRVLIESLEKKTSDVSRLLEEYNGSWEDALYVTLAKNFGFKINALPFELLARSIPVSILAKHADRPIQIQSLLFGQSGFLNETFDDPYPATLKKEYEHLKRKYSLKSMDRFLWKFGRLRPNNFPTIRIAQFGTLLAQSDKLFSRIVNSSTIDQIKTEFRNVEAPEYWSTHYHFRKPAERMTPRLGLESTDNIICNTVAPFLFLYGLKFHDIDIKERAIRFLELLPAEDNKVVRGFKKIGISCSNCGESQALLHLKKMYCDQKKCLNCGIGIKLLKKEHGTANINIF